MIQREQIAPERGKIFNIEKIEETYDNIYNLGVFDNIRVEPDLNSSSADVPIKIELEEGKTQEFNSKLGYDTYEGLEVVLSCKP